MTEPQIRERNYQHAFSDGEEIPPEVAHWFYVSAKFASARAAERAYTRMMARMPVGSSAVGIYRHGPPKDPGRWISAVSLQRPGIERVAGLLEGGFDADLDLGLIDTLIARRLKVLLSAPGQTGRMRIRHAGKGARMTPGGDAIEPGGGEG